MLRVQMDKIGDLAIVECEGRIVCREEALNLHEAVTLHQDARIVVVDLSEVVDLAAYGVFMLVFLQKWAHNHDVQLKLFNPSRSVRLRLEQAGAIPEFDIAPLGEMMALLSQADNRYALDGKESAVHQAA